MQTKTFSLQDKEILKEVLLFAKARRAKLYLVGGSLRDLFIGRRKVNPDFDFTLKRNAIAFGRKLAKEMACGFVVLDEEHGACRLVLKLKNKICTLDFTDFRAPGLEKDLLHRDFTINSMALELEKAVNQEDLSGSLIDLYGAREDLKAKLIRVAHKRSFVEDPLRILRAFSFASMLGFEVDKETLRLAEKEKARLAKVSFERVRDELFKIFDSDNAFECFKKLDELKIIKIIFPEIEKMRGIGQGPYHHLDVWQHTLETIKQLEFLYLEVKDKPDIKSFLDEPVSSERSRRSLLKFGAFLHDIGKPAALRYEGEKTIFHGHERLGLDLTKDICRRLRLSNDEISALHKIVLWHLRPGYMADNKELTPRAKFRYFRDTASEALSVLLLSVADQRATKGPLTTKASRANHEKVVFGLIKEYFKKAKEEKLPRLVTGDDLIKAFKLQPSPLIGKILSEIEEAHAIGKIKNKQDALKLAKRCINSKKK
ncbi:MAG: HD domain-containing protein [Candidatus Omnitrophica bacterium]|nr:HD domain-containing protein [Candidatus Omnitrophota bacterium]MBU1870148.1 HD domain-containing protein [Candidatus Omnitrophota bacterium]